MNEAVSSGKGVWVEGGLLADDTIIEIKRRNKRGEFFLKRLPKTDPSESKPFQFLAEKTAL
jgi:hypothetical protein